jgi:hypothetical protein
MLLELKTDSSGTIQELSLAGRSSWFVSRGLSPALKEEVRALVENIETPSEDAYARNRALLRELCSRIREDQSAETTDMLSIVRRQMTAGVFPELAPPEPLQFTVAQEALKAGLEDRLLERLDKFTAAMPEIVRFLPAYLSGAGETRLYDYALARIVTSSDFPASVRTAIGCRLNEWAVSGDNRDDISFERIQLIALKLKNLQDEAQAAVFEHLIEALFDRALFSHLTKIITALPRENTLWVDRCLDALLTGNDFERNRFLKNNLTLFPESKRCEVLLRAVGLGGLALLPHVNQDYWTRLDQSRCAKLVIKSGHARFMARYLQWFSALDAEVAKELMAVKRSLVAEHLASFRRLPAEIAVTLIKHGAHAAVFGNLRSFHLPPDEFRSLLMTALARGCFEFLLNKLDVIPEKLLQGVESEFRLVEYRRRIGIGSMSVYNAFVGCSPEKADRFELYISRLRDWMCSAGAQPPDIAARLFYSEVVQTVFSSHTDFYTSFESNERCADRTSDLARFKLRPAYEMTLAGNVEMVLKPGASADAARLATVLAPLHKAHSHLFSLPADRVEEALKEKLSAAHRRRSSERETIDEQLTALLLEARLGLCPSDKAKEAAHFYHSFRFEDLRGYCEGTRAKAEAAENPQYAHLLYLREFFADHLHDTLHHLVESAFQAKDFQTAAEEYRRRFNEAEAAALNKQRANRLGRLGLTPKFLDRLAKAAADPNLTPGQRRLALAGMIGAEQRRTAAAIKKITGKTVDPGAIHLASVSVPALAAGGGGLGQAESRGGNQDLKKMLLGFFDSDLDVIDDEIAKYKPKDGRRGRSRTLVGYVTKNHTSAHARGVAGVCVAGDNPDHVGEKQHCQWNLENFFQMVLKDGETRRCEGVLLLHHYAEPAGRILTASFQPTSTYLLKVDAEELFHTLLNQLVVFACDNDFDFIACSTNPQIRTNRTGGVFEQAIKKQIAGMNHRLDLSKPRVFSYRPDYRQKELDVLWRREQNFNVRSGLR